MALTLNETLAAVQTQMKRHPLAEIISTQPMDAIPYDGQYLDDSTDTEHSATTIAHSTGRVIDGYVRDNDIYFIYTDIAKTFWTEANVLSGSSIEGVSFCELVNGNVGIVFIDGSDLKAMVVSVTGAVVTAASTIETFAATVADPFVIKLSDDSYFLVYAHLTGSTYSIQKRTSSDFFTWAAGATISLASPVNPNFKIYNPALLQVDSDDILLYFDHVTDINGDAEVINLFTAVSDDSGATFGTPAKLTNYTSWGTGGHRPYPALTSTNEITLGFHEENNVLFLNSDDAAWQNECGDPGYSVGAAIHFDPSSDYLYIQQLRMNTGLKRLCGVTVLNTNTWEVVKNYNTSTVPSYSSVFDIVDVWYGAKKHQSAGHYVAISTFNTYEKITAVINHAVESITQYVFRTGGSFGLSVNVEPDFRTSSFEQYAKIFSTFVDADNDRLYLGFTTTSISPAPILVGYIDLTETADPATGMYTFNEVAYNTTWSVQAATGLVDESGGMLLLPDEGFLALYGRTSSAGNKGKFELLNLSTGSSVLELDYDDVSSFPYQGIGNICYAGGIIYGSITYHTSHGQSIYRGLCAIDISTSAVVYHRPTYATVDSYSLPDLDPMDDGRILVASRGYGVSIFDPADGSWTLYNNTNLPGFEPTAYNPNVWTVAYDEDNERIFAGSVTQAGADGYAGIRMFSVNGSFKQGQYKTGTLSGGVWSYTAQADLSQGLMDSDFAMAIDGDDVLWSAWTRQDDDEHSIKWDKDEAEKDLTNYLISTSSIQRAKSIDRPGRVEFSLSHGHLFDQNNNLSALNIFSKKGRPLTLRFGEKINGVEYWQAQGTYYITDLSLSYSRGQYPTAKIAAEDRLNLIDDVKVIASDYYSGIAPAVIIDDLLSDFTNLEVAEINIPALSGTHNLYHQVIDDGLVDAIKDILDHFGYVLFADVDNKITVKQIRTSVDSVDNTYSDNTLVSDFSPDDQFSDYTNRVIVKGEALDPLEVLYAEELVGTVEGTGGWWEDKDKVLTVYFSEDREKKCRDVRLNIIKSISDFEILWIKSKGTEYISATDTDEKYIQITVEFPGLMVVLIGLIAAVVALGAVAVTCDGVGTGYCGSIIAAFSVLMSAISYILGQIATYHYEVYGRPVGEEKQTIQATANDTDLQQYLDGLIVTAEIEDQFCYTVAQCQTVADYELSVVQAQRSRVSFSKIANLEDEVADILRITHPYSGQAIDVFVTNITRVFKKGSVKGDSGSFIDKIEGWKL